MVWVDDHIQGHQHDHDGVHNFFPEITIPVKTNNKEQLDQVMIVHYYQPNHDIVNVEVFLDKKINGTFSAPYCPSISGCRDLIKFESNSETFNKIYEHLLETYNSYRLKEIEEIFKEFGIENSQDLEKFYINYSSEYTNRVLRTLI